MKKLVITAASVLGLSTFALGQGSGSTSAGQSSAAAQSPAKVEEKSEKSCDKKSWWSWGKKRRHHKRGLGRVLMQSEPIRTALAAKAKAAGHDIETREGKRAFFKSIKEQKKAWVKAQGVDMSSRKARRDLRTKLAAEQKAEADKLGYNLDSLAGKEQYALHMINNDRIHELMMGSKMGGKKRRHDRDDDDR